MKPDLMTSIEGMIGYTEDDLIANREGKLSNAQRQNLSAKRQGFLVLAGVSLVITLGLFAGIFFDSALKSSDKLSIVAFICLALAVALLYVWLKWSQYTTDLERGVAFAAEGELKLVTYQNRGNRLYQFRVNRIEFRAEKVLFDLLTDLAKEYPYCAVYYAPESHVLLAFESLDRI